MNRIPNTLWRRTRLLGIGLAVGLLALASLTVGAAVPGFAAPFSVAKAMTALYGNYDAQTGSSAMAQLVVPADKHFTGNSYPNHTAVVVSPLLVQPFRHDGRQAVLLLTQAVKPSGFSCRACTPMLGGAVYVRTDGQYRMVGNDRTLLPAGSDGRAPMARVVQLAPGMPGVLFRDALYSAGQGVSVFDLIAVVDGRPALVLKADGDDVVDIPGQEYATHARIAFVKNPRTGVKDVLVRFSGTERNAKGEQVPVHRQVRYVFTAGHYRIAR